MTYLASVRGWAASVVLFSHIVQIFWLPFWGLDSWQHRFSSVASEYAVIVFFLLSGFLIAHSIEQNRRRNGRVRLFDFLAARFARIYPPFAFAVLVCVLVYALLAAFSLPGYASDLKWPSDLYHVRDRITLTSGEIVRALRLQAGLLTINGPLWSLYIEIRLYLLFGFGYCFLMAPRRAALIGVLFCLTAYYSLRDSPEFVRYAGFWFAGCCAYYLRGCRISGDQRRQALPRLAIVAGAVVVCLVVQHAVPALKTSGGSAGVWLDFPIVVALAAALFWRPFQLPLGRWLASWSYSLYVVHFPLLLLCQALLIRSGNDSTLAVGLASIAALLVAFGVGRLGGLLEARKEFVQSILVRSGEYISQRFTKSLGKNGI